LENIIINPNFSRKRFGILFTIGNPAGRLRPPENGIPHDSHFLEAFDFDAGKGEEIADFVERAGAKIEEFFEPIERNVHEAGRRRRDGGFFNRKTRK
jgi:hypothetical protein